MLSRGEACLIPHHGQPYQKQKMEDIYRIRILGNDNSDCIQPYRLYGFAVPVE